MEMFQALMIVLLVFAVGDMVGTVTKAKISSMFVIMVGFLVLFLAKILPADIINTAGLTTMCTISIQFLLFNMGTTVDLGQLKREWRTVVASCLGMLIAVVACVVVAPVISKEAAMVSAPVLTGGIAALTIVQEAANAKGLAEAAALAAFVFAVQKFFGTLPASRCGLRYANRIVGAMRENQSDIKLESAEQKSEGKEHKPTFYERHAKYYTVFVCLAIGSIAAYIATVLGSLSGISATIWSMALGIAARAIGVVPPNYLKTKGNAQGVFSWLALASVIPSLGRVDIIMVPIIGFKVIVIFAVAMVAIFLVFKFTPAWRILGDKDLSIGVAMCQMIGYPGTQLVVDEIAKAVAQNDDEYNTIEGKLATAYVISGFASVTLLSVFIAGFMVKFL